MANLEPIDTTQSENNTLSKIAEAERAKTAPATANLIFLFILILSISSPSRTPGVSQHIIESLVPLNFV